MSRRSGGRPCGAARFSLDAKPGATARHVDELHRAAKPVYSAFAGGDAGGD